MTWQKLLITGVLGKNTLLPNKTPRPIGLFYLFSDFLQEVSYLAVVVLFGMILGAIVVMLIPSSYFATPISAVVDRTIGLDIRVGIHHSSATILSSEVVVPPNRWIHLPNRT